MIHLNDIKYTRISGASRLSQIIIEHNLYLPKGLMLDLLAKGHLRAPKQVFGYVATINGTPLAVGVYSPLEIHAGDGMVFVQKRLRGRGVAEELVKRLLEGNKNTVYFYPWDLPSIALYRKLFNKGILGEDNFWSYELSLVKSGAQYITSDVHSRCRQAERAHHG